MFQWESQDLYNRAQQLRVEDCPIFVAPNLYKRKTNQEESKVILMAYGRETRQVQVKTSGLTV